MQEEIKIGNVTLNFKHYSGVDLYSDGAIENDLLEIVKKYKKEEYPQVIGKGVTGRFSIIYLSREPILLNGSLWQKMPRS